MIFELHGEHGKSGKPLYATGAIYYLSQRERTSMFWNEVSLCFLIEENLDMVIQKHSSSHTVANLFGVSGYAGVWLRTLLYLSP